MAKCFRNNLHVAKTGVVEAFRNLQIKEKVVLTGHGLHARGFSKALFAGHI
jgi:hypothetical protein